MNDDAGPLSLGFAAIDLQVFQDKDMDSKMT